ncbi:MAG: Na+/H+ antiporter subunit E [Anaerolineae bacterium]
MFLFIAMIFIWVFLTGELSWGNVGFASFLSLLLVFTSGRRMQVSYFQPRKGFNIFKYLVTLARFSLFFLGQLVIAGSTVFWSILNPRGLQPGVIAVPLDVKSRPEITLLANLITLTPGTLTLDVSTDRRVMYVHTIDFEDVESFRKEIKNGFEKRVIEVMNP